jgi:hypothetical protein
MPKKVEGSTRGTCPKCRKEFVIENVKGVKAGKKKPPSGSCF